MSLVVWNSLEAQRDATDRSRGISDVDQTRGRAEGQSISAMQQRAWGEQAALSSATTVEGRR